MYEALRAYFLEGHPSQEVARAFGYTPGSFRVLCHQFRRERDPQFFVSPASGPREQPKKSKARDVAVALRKQNHSVYEIAEALKASNLVLSPTAVRELLRTEGFAALPRRLDEERPGGPAPTAEPVADVRGFGLVADTEFVTRCGGLFLFVPDLVRLQVAGLAGAAKLPGSVMIPAEHALRAALALKLWSIERKSHIMALVADPGLGLFCGLNATPKKSYLSEYSSRLGHAHTTGLLGAWHRAVARGVGTAESWIAINNYVNRTMHVRLAGCPTDYWALDPVALFFGQVGVSAKAPHPNAARLAANFMLSQECQAFLAKFGRLPTRADVPSTPPGIVEQLKTRKVVTVLLGPDEEKKWQRAFDGLFRRR